MNLSRTLLSLGTVAVLIVGIAGCASPEPAQTSTPVASTPTATPTPTHEPEVRVVISTLTLDVYTDDALTHSWVHADRDPTEIPGLTEVFDSEPVITTETHSGEGGSKEWQYYTWGGFKLYFIASEFGSHTVWASATAPSVGDVQIEAVGGVQVGDDAQALAAADPDSASTRDSPSGQFLYIKVGQIPSAADPSGTYSVDGDPSTDYVAVYSDAPFTTVTRIYGPTLNYGL